MASYFRSIMIVFLSFLYVVPIQAEEKLAKLTNDLAKNAQRIKQQLYQAKRKDQFSLIIFEGGSWAPAYQDFQSKVLNQPGFKDWVNERFQVIRVQFINPNQKQKEIRSLLKKYKITVFPTILLLSPAEKILHRFVIPNYKSFDIFTKEVDRILIMKENDRKNKS